MTALIPLVLEGGRQRPARGRGPHRHRLRACPASDQGPRRQPLGHPLLTAFATPGQAQTFRAALVDGLGWGKQAAAGRPDRRRDGPKARALRYRWRTQSSWKIFAGGARKGPRFGHLFLQTLREGPRLRRMNAIASPQAHPAEGDAAVIKVPGNRRTVLFRRPTRKGRTLVQGPFRSRQGLRAGLVAQFKSAKAGQWQSLGLRASEGVADQEVDASLDALRAAQRPRTPPRL